MRGGPDSQRRDIGSDWDFHRATGMVAAQMQTNDMDVAARRLIEAAAEMGASLHETALLVLDRRLRLDAPSVDQEAPA